MKSLLTILALGGVVLALAGCGGIGGSGSAAAVDSSTALAVPQDVGKAHRVVFVLTDVSCDMNTPQDRQNRERGLLVGAHAAALDGGVLEVGVVRAVARQNVNWEQTDFSLLNQSASTPRFRVQNALSQRDRAVARLRKFVQRSSGNVTGCASDLVSALSSVTTKVQELGRGSGSRIDLVFVTNGLIVDRRTKIILTKNSLATDAQYQRVLQAMLHGYPMPRLDGIHVWLVGAGWSAGIRNDLTGDRVRGLWTTYLKKAGASVTVHQNSTDLPGLLGET